METAIVRIISMHRHPTNNRLVFDPLQVHAVALAHSVIASKRHQPLAQQEN
jgi:hypothetical protein